MPATVAVRPDGMSVPADDGDSVHENEGWVGSGLDAASYAVAMNACVPPMKIGYGDETVTDDAVCAPAARGTINASATTVALRIEREIVG